MYKVLISHYLPSVVLTFYLSLILFALLVFSVPLFLLALLVVPTIAFILLKGIFALLDVNSTWVHEVQFVLLFSCFGQLLYNENQTVCVESTIVLLAESERTVFPVRHLFAFTHINSKYFFAYFCKAHLSSLVQYASKDALSIVEVSDQSPELHVTQAFSKHFKITFEAKTNNCTLI